MTKNSKAIREGYDDIADKIAMPEKFYRECLNLIRTAEGKDGRVLDVGCGQGFLLKRYKTRFNPPSLFGLDHSLELCRRATGNLGSPTIVEGDLHFPPYKDSSFSLVMMTEVLEHVEDPGRVLKELKRIISPGGRLLLSVPNRDWLRYDRYLKRRSVFQPVDDRWFGALEIKGFIESAGFTIKKVRGQENLYFGGGPGRLAEKIGLRFISSLHEKMKRLIILAEKGSSSVK